MNRTVQYSGSFDDIQALIDACNEMLDDETLHVRVPKRKPHNGFPDVEENAYQCFLYAVRALQNEILGGRRIELKIEFV